MAAQRRKVLAEGKYLRLVAEKGWEFAERSRGLDAVAIVAVTTEDELILTEQFRVPLGKSVIDLPAGLVGDEQEESLVTAARRELEEETGYRARRMKKVFSGPTSAGLSNEVVNILLADGVEKVHDGGGAGDEQITVHVVPRAGLMKWLRARERRGLLIAPNVLVAMMLLNP